MNLTRKVSEYYHSMSYAGKTVANTASIVALGLFLYGTKAEAKPWFPQCEGAVKQVYQALESNAKKDNVVEARLDKCNQNAIANIFSKKRLNANQQFAYCNKIGSEFSSWSNNSQDIKLDNITIELARGNEQYAFRIEECVRQASQTAVKENKAGLCQDIDSGPLDNGYLKTDCLTAFAVANQDLSICSKLDYDYDSSCHEKVGEKLKDPKKCKSLKESDDISSCLQGTAIGLKDERICLEMKEDTWSYSLFDCVEALSKIKHVRNACLMIPAEDIRERCYSELPQYKPKVNKKKIPPKKKAHKR